METVALDDLANFLEDVLVATTGPFHPGKSYGAECIDIIYGDEKIEGCGEEIAILKAWDNQSEMWNQLAEVWTLHLYNDHGIGEWELSG